MHYLIDGYNLLYAMGVLLQGRTGPTVLAKARLRLLGFLHAAHKDDAADVTVVFDAKQAPAGLPSEVDFEGIHVAFAVDQAQADDLIEMLIRKASVPRQLTVVSNDHRIQQAARRRNCVVLDCSAYLDQLEGSRRPPPPRPPVEAPKPDAVSGEETQRWLREFADLADDPGMKELFDLPGLNDE
jgi:predicted RNA-binding protein with PIN domain